MKLTILDKSKVKYGDRYLSAYQTYHDIDDATAEELIGAGLAQRADDKIAAVSVNDEVEAPKTPVFDKKKNGGYVGEAVIPEAKKKKLEAEGKLDDETPVVGEDKELTKDKEPDPVEKTKVYDDNGNELTDEQVAERERVAAAKAGGEKADTVGDLQNSGEEVK